MNNSGISVGGNFENSGVFNTGEIRGSVTNVVGDNNIVNTEAIEKIAEIIANLQKRAELLPETQREDVQSDLEDLEKEIQKPPEEQRPGKVKRYLKGLVAAVASVLVGMGVASERVKTVSTNAVDIIGNAVTITEDVQRITGNRPEFKALSPSDWEVVETVKVFSDGIEQIAEAYQFPSE